MSFDKVHDFLPTFFSERGHLEQKTNHDYGNFHSNFWHSKRSFTHAKIDVLKHKVSLVSNSKKSNYLQVFKKKVSFGGENKRQLKMISGPILGGLGGF